MNTNTEDDTSLYLPLTQTAQIIPVRINQENYGVAWLPLRQAN